MAEGQGAGEVAAGRLELADYRRRVHELYGRVRATAAGDPAAAHALWRRGRDDLFAHHPQSALDEAGRAAFRGLRYYRYDPAMRFAARVELDLGSPARELPASRDAPLAFERLGTVDLPIGRLELHWLVSYAGGLFLAFRDGTSGSETYAGGRYLLDTAKGADLGTDADGRLILDFNFAYHPSCCYNPIWACPLAPRSNWLAVRIEAGERSVGPAPAD